MDRVPAKSIVPMQSRGQAAALKGLEAVGLNCLRFPDPETDNCRVYSGSARAYSRSLALPGPAMTLDQVCLVLLPGLEQCPLVLEGRLMRESALFPSEMCPLE